MENVFQKDQTMRFSFAEYPGFKQFCGTLAFSEHFPGQDRVAELYNGHVNKNFLGYNRVFDSDKLLHIAAKNETTRIEKEMKSCIQCERGCLPCLRHADIKRRLNSNIEGFIHV